MSMMYKLRDTLANELDKVAEKENLTHSDLDLVHTLSDTIKNLDKIEQWKRMNIHMVECGQQRGTMIVDAEVEHTMMV